MSDHVEAEPVSLDVWWEPVELAVGQSWRYNVGTLLLYLQRGDSEWQLAWRELEDIAEHYRVVSEPAEALPAELPAERFVFQKVPGRFCLKPRLLDRPVVVKNLQPVHLPAGEHVTFYISSPVCVVVELSKPVMLAREIPTLRLSDTWFGPSTREGELCYATRTHARSRLQDLPRRPHRAVTPVTVHNQSSEVLTIDKLSIPVPYLAVYGTAEGVLWTDPVSLRHTTGSALAVLDVDKHLPASVGKVTRLAEPRMAVQRGSLVRAFTSMFSN